MADDREEFRRPELFPAGADFTEVDRDYSVDFLEGRCGRELCAVVVTRCWETDLAALVSILRQAPPALSYLGLMGSRRKVERVRKEIEASGVSVDEGRLHAPIGLPIGAESPGEIAVSILAELIASRRTADAPQQAAVAAPAVQS